jgi:choline kinase
MNINSDNNYGGNRISTALLLAAGTGSRLFPLTKTTPKCLTLVNEKSILERLVNNLKKLKKTIINTTRNCYGL